MKYIEEFRDDNVAKKIAKNIQRECQRDKTYNIMEFCGGHTHAIFRYGVQNLMPDNINYIHGPGCPVCVLPINRLDAIIDLIKKKDVIVCSYGDLLRVPGSDKISLMKIKAQGADIRMIYSALDTIKIAQDNPKCEVIFFAIGFETTTPPTAVLISMIKKLQINNLSIFCNHVLTPSAMCAILDMPLLNEKKPVVIEGFLGPSHVSSIIGTKSYEFVPKKYQKPIVIAGFEPLDVMQATLMVVRQLNEGRCEVENEYNRAVQKEGNKKAQGLVAEYLELRDTFAWRGLGYVKKSALKIKDKYKEYDSEYRFEIVDKETDDIKGCQCADVLRGLIKPIECKLYKKVCTPENPMGACMVSSEGACAAFYSYGGI
jgi:hydrogenase expression/formation protein HypD